jgi:hypothetical protein|tara:strand:- start:2367 stop:3113 length:747 start_codon:yes stop_codon:yes gene_type:complete
MKKIIYTLLAITLVFSACKKEDEDTAPTNTTVSGCMDNLATNYNALATVDNGNCIYAGCMDSTALNYNALATVDDGSCEYQTIAYVPDDNFEQYLINNGWDDVMDDSVKIAAIDTVKIINVYFKNISNLTGIEYFINLRELNCHLNQLISLDLSENTKLTILNCEENQLTSMDISNNPEIFYLNCLSNQLTTLNLKNGANISELFSVDARNNPNLSCIQVDDVAFADGEADWGSWGIDSHHYFSTNCQ